MSAEPVAGPLQDALLGGRLGRLSLKESGLKMFEGSLFVSGALIGSMVFFVAVIAPLVFQVLEPEQGGAFLRRVFPRFYRFGLVVALIAAGLAFQSVPLAALTFGLVGLAFLLSDQVLTPAINRARDAGLGGDEAAHKRFEMLHKLSVRIFSVQALAVVVGFVMLVRHTP